MTRPATPVSWRRVPRRAAARRPLAAAALAARAAAVARTPSGAEVRAYLERVQRRPERARKDVLVRADTVLRGYAQGATIGAPAPGGRRGRRPPRPRRRRRGLPAARRPRRPRPPPEDLRRRRRPRRRDPAHGRVRGRRPGHPRTTRPREPTLRRDLRRAHREQPGQGPGPLRRHPRPRLAPPRRPRRPRAARARPRSQLKRLASTRRLSRQLQSAVRAKDSRRVAKLLLRFRKSTQAPAASERALTKRGITAYTSRLKELTEAQKEFGRAQARLNRTFRETET